MNPIKKLVALYCIVLAVAAGAAQASTLRPINEPARVAFRTQPEKPAPVENVRLAIKDAAKQLLWEVAEDQPGSMTLRRTKGGDKHVAVVRVSYDPAGYQIHYVSSVNLKYGQVERDGTVMIHWLYNEWIKQLGHHIEVAYYLDN